MPFLFAWYYNRIAVPGHDPTPECDKGELDWSRVTAIKILGVEDNPWLTQVATNTYRITW